MLSQPGEVLSDLRHIGRSHANERTSMGVPKGIGLCQFLTVDDRIIEFATLPFVTFGVTIRHGKQRYLPMQIAGDVKAEIVTFRISLCIPRGVSAERRLTNTVGMKFTKRENLRRLGSRT